MLGTGGQEAAIFVKEMAELYEKYCRNTRGWKFSVIEESPSDDCGGFKVINIVRVFPRTLTDLSCFYSFRKLLQRFVAVGPMKG